MDAIVHDSTASPRFTMLLLILLGGTGLLLAAIGIYGVIAYQVGQRTREIGVRLALGATPGSVWSLVVRQAMTVALAGVLAGELLALVAARALSGLIYGVAPSDPLTFTSMGVILTGTALVASLVPAVRATRIDPIRALRS
jgi:ABC-type antimicrobial peptide transport system permease subunit